MKLVLAIVAFVIALGVGVYAYKFNTPEPQMAVLEPAPTHADSIIGHSVEGREIIAYTYGNGSKHLLFVGGIHGGYEWNSVVLADTFIAHLAAHPEIIPANLSITVIPNLNPDAVYEAIGKEGSFTVEDVPKGKDLSESRFNANDVDLNRNFDCKWQPKSTWRSRSVSAGSAPFSEPEALALKGFVEHLKPEAVVFWHSQSNAVYASECEKGILPVTREIMNAYSKASGYPAVDSFDAYPVTGDAEGWLASIGIPAISVELSSHEVIEWEKNMKGVEAMLEYFSK